MVKSLAESQRSLVATMVNWPYPKPSHDKRTFMQTRESIEKHWTKFPPQVKDFILNWPDATPDGFGYSISKLVNFWSQPQNINCLQGRMAESLCGSVWRLALMYLRMDMMREARSLTVNGSFIHQCYNSSIEYFKRVPGELYSQKLPYFYRGFDSIGSPQQMESYIHQYLPKDYTQMMSIFEDLSNASSMMGYINQISDDWNEPPSKSHQPLRSNDGGETIKITLEDDSNKDKTSSFDINSSKTLKSLFNDYAHQRGVSLRSLRFSHAGKTLFLSNAGHNTPEQMGMKDQDIIKVHNSSTVQELSAKDSSSQAGAYKSPASRNNRIKKRSNKKAKGRGKKRQQYREPARTFEECRVEHSKQLTEIHDEAQAQFKSIRQRLNNLSIERSQPKARRCPAPKHVPPPSPSEAKVHCDEGLGGKAGKSHFLVQVGEVQNLYKTAKRSASLAWSSAPVPSLDLHGCTREEALSRLDESLESWVEEAMRGSYPFVSQVAIVCGCGSQTLSDTVEGWIRSNARVSNAPRMRYAGRSRPVGRNNG